jgi:isopentenyl-diphosphate Delta-isomerase
MEEKVILVDSQDKPIGLMDKMEAHERAFLHRAFSVFVFNSKGEMLLQRRALDKYHSGGLWTNTCCSHPRDGETVEQAGLRRMQEEMGFVTDLNYGFYFIYHAPLDHGLTEHELDHVLTGHSDEMPKINTDEVCDWKYNSIADLQLDMAQNPENYTAWFRIIMEDYGDKIYQAAGINNTHLA